MNVVIYARYSSHGQNEQSIEGQIKECREYAKRYNYTIIHEYIDRAKSGTKDAREQFLRMIEDSKQKKFQGVLVYQLDRFARNKYDSAVYKKQLKDKGVRVLSAKENISDDASGKILETLLEGMAEYYSDELSQKVKRGMRINNEHNYYNGGTITFGYATKSIDSPFIDSSGRPIKKQIYVVDEVNAPHVTQIFNDIYNGMKGHEVIKKLKSLGVKNSRGNYFDKSSLYNLLRNKKYITISTYDGEEHIGAYPRLVEDEVFYEVQRILEKNKRNFNKRAKDEYLLATKMFCGYCNDFMVGGGGTSKTGKVHHYYLCKNAKAKTCHKKNIRKQLIEDLVIDTTREFLTKDNIDKIATTVVSLLEKEQENSRLKQLKKSISTIDRKKANIINAISECDNSDIRKCFYEELSRLEEQRSIIELDIASEEVVVNTLSKSNIKHFLNQLKTGNVNDIKYRKSLIATFINAVYVYDDKVIIFFNNQENSKEITFDMVEEVNGVLMKESSLRQMDFNPI